MALNCECEDVSRATERCSKAYCVCDNNSTKESIVLEPASSRIFPQEVSSDVSTSTNRSGGVEGLRTSLVQCRMCPNCTSEICGLENESGFASWMLPAIECLRLLLNESVLCSAAPIPPLKRAHRHRAATRIAIVCNNQSPVSHQCAPAANILPMLLLRTIRLSGRIQSSQSQNLFY